jgi:hypothetical protein
MGEEGVPSLGGRGLAVEGYKLAVCHPLDGEREIRVQHSQLPRVFVGALLFSFPSVRSINQSINQSIASFRSSVTHAYIHTVQPDLGISPNPFPYYFQPVARPTSLPAIGRGLTSALSWGTPIFPRLLT